VSIEERISAGNTLVVYGVASIKIFEGKASILGCPIVPRRGVLVRPERALPIYAETDLKLEITRGEESRLKRYDCNTIPNNWARVSDELISGYRKVMVVGKSDSAKSSFSCYLANYALLHGREVQLFDMDPGQANIGPPTMVSYANISAPLYDPFTLYVEDAAHVGYTSPSHGVEQCINAVKDLVTRAAIRSSLDFSILDSDGWVEGMEAERYKIEFARVCGTDAAVLIGVPPNSPLLRKMRELNIEVLQVDKPQPLSLRGINARRRLRSMGYRKYLKEARVRTLPTSWIRIDSLVASPEASAQDYLRNIYCRMEQSPSPQNLWGASADKDVGLLSYAYDDTGSFKGIGLVENINLKRDHIRIFTPIGGSVASLVLGCMILGKDGVEVYCAR